MKTYRFLICSSAFAALLIGCKVQTNTETVPEAEGNGKRAVNIRVEPMNREEIKDATGKVIDATAETAGEVKDAVTSVAAETRDLARDTNAAVKQTINERETTGTP